jgi:multisubunit Na+/H+ antiporter MnhC subunit
MHSYLCSAALLLIGIYCVAAKKDPVRIVIGLVIMEFGLELLLAAVGFHQSVLLVPLASLPGLATVALAAVLAARSRREP